jgi:hypothetical protein
MPLRHEGDEFAARRQMREISDDDALIADLPGDLAQLVMGPRQEGLEQPQLRHHLERRGVDGVAAEIAQEIGVLLQHDGVDAGARQQRPQHHPRRPAADDAAAGADLARRGTTHALSYNTDRPSA